MTVRMMPIAAAALLLAGQAFSPSANAEGFAAPQFAPCKLGDERAKNRPSAQCGSFTVPEDYRDPDGKTISLRVARIPAKDQEPKPDAVTFLAGGPGQAATEAYPQLAGAFAEINAERDILLVDQRGTGGSNKLNCTVGSGDPFEEFSGDMDFTAHARECLQQMSGDTRFYNTYVAVRDLEELRNALGYSQLNLVGVSYGTRAALTYMRQYPDSVRSAILDGVAPLQIALGFDHADNLDRALDAIFALCAADTTCFDRFGDVGTKLDDLMQRLGETSTTLRVASPRSGKAREIPMDRNILRVAVRLFAYTPETVSLLPLLIDDAWQSGSFGRIAAQALMVMEDLSDALARGMELSVMCAEDVPFYRAENHSAEEATLLGRVIVDGSIDQCKVWPVGEIPDNSKAPLESSIPTLLLSGELDPVTPPAFGEMAARSLSRSLHLVAPGQGHNVLPRGCAATLAARFIADGNVDGLDASCIERLGPAPFFTSFTGPQP